MTCNPYAAIFIQILLAILIVVGILVASHFLGQRALGTKIKNSPYECGLIAEGKAHPRFAVKFYVTALLFILFDIELVFLAPWALIHREFVVNHISIVGPVFFFIGLLLLGLWYELRKKALEWDK